MKKYLLIIAALALVLALSACSNSSKDAQDDADTDESTTEESQNIENLQLAQEPQVMAEQVIKPQVFAEGEEIENYYYKRDLDTGCYLVVLEDDEEVSLPMDKTTLYISENETPHYAEVLFTYQNGDETIEDMEYQLFANSAAPDESN